MKLRHLVCCTGLLFVAAAVRAAEPVRLGGRLLAVRDAEGVDAMEHTAQAARELFWRGRPAEARAALDALCREAHNSTALYLRERAMCSFALGDFAAAKQDLIEAAHYAENMRLAGLESKALTLSGRESVKVYSGDPYETATNYLLLALLFLRDGDADSALAACKSGLLADADATEGRYTSDLTLLHLLEAKCLALRGDAEGARASAAAAEESHRQSHPSAREILTQRLDLLELLKLDAKQRKKLKKPENAAVIQAELAQVDDRLQAVTRGVDVAGELGVLLTGDYNTIVLIPAERGLRKTRTGKAGNFVVFEGVESGAPAPRLRLDGADSADILPVAARVADISFQATTRGGRRMDGILAGQAAYRNTTIGVGDMFLEMSRNNNNDGGMLLLGTIIAVIGNSFNAEADTRCWQTLPARFHVAALRLPAGRHTMSVVERRYFEARENPRVEFVVPEQGMATVFAGGLGEVPYSEAAIATSVARKRRMPAGDEAPERIVALAPPLGLARITRCTVAGREKPLVYTADPNRLMQQMERDLDGLGVDAFQMVHAEIMQDREAAARKASSALQTELIESGIAGSDFVARWSFKVVACASGSILAQTEARGAIPMGDVAKADANGLFNAACNAAWAHARTDTALLAAIRSGANAGRSSGIGANQP